jgi:hypothetical protein
MECAKRGAANGQTPWQAERQSRPPGKPRPIQVAAKCGVCIVALLGFVVLATTFVARLASIRILPATQFAEDSIRGSLTKRVQFGHTQIRCVCDFDHKIGLSLAIGLFTKNRRYLNFAWQLFKFFAVFAVVIMALFVLERLILVI